MYPSGLHAIKIWVPLSDMDTGPVPVTVPKGLIFQRVVLPITLSRYTVSPETAYR